ncbi:putative mitochondrial aldo-keto reductase (AKR) [Leptomonas pyrrhocoris]|uniref:9,11-endoperoxide prostaglandin H2 reductase n=1 Tax=Leptomonas pyrrhocoris TaxID=157538 RepID=A0A0M9G2B1_LEPPY|nr:putative mitochondrial aldo-keto reductase (AKR) [Leptomonas pyrrhocoris]KPA80905.1 putative mitochondrial aldo-keto reductase (AKR) [Leptomonas pyrrhocoris]|eukprot:XP_015659344.1 putative mitochondrial aldo-keto reductase (AKR) [Leptomonas pyrrhocoris]
MPSSADNAYVVLHNQHRMPQLGLGVWKAAGGDQTYQNVKCALEVGYRLIDTASLYGNEADVGRAVRDCGVPREEVFITTKVWNSDHGYQKTIDALERSLAALGVDYVDLYLIHWPGPQESFLETWKAMEFLYEKGKAHAIGLSNFDADQTQAVLDHCKIRPMVNQVEVHPLAQQKALRSLCAKAGVVVMASRPLCRGEALKLPILQEIASKHHHTVAQVLLRWNLQSGMVAIPKSNHTDRIRENFQIHDFVLDDGEMKKIEALNEEKLFGNDSKTFFPLEYGP